MNNYIIFVINLGSKCGNHKQSVVSIVETGFSADHASMSILLSLFTIGEVFKSNLAASSCVSCFNLTPYFHSDVAC